jgi:hypothetical protein
VNAPAGVFWVASVSAVIACDRNAIQTAAEIPSLDCFALFAKTPEAIRPQHNKFEGRQAVTEAAGLNGELRLKHAALGFTRA